MGKKRTGIPPSLRENWKPSSQTHSWCCFRIGRAISESTGHNDIPWVVAGQGHSTPELGLSELEWG